MTTIKRYTKSGNTNNGGGNSGTPPKGSKDNPYTMAEYLAIPDEEWKGGYVEEMGYVLPNVDVWGSSTSNAYSDNFSDWFSNWPYYGPSSPWSNMFSNPKPDDRPDDNGNGNNGTGDSGNNDNNENSNTFHLGADPEDNSTGEGGNTNPYPQITRLFHKGFLAYNPTEGMGLQASFVYNYYVSISGYKMTIGVEVLPPIFEGKEFWARLIKEVPGHSPQIYQVQYNPNGYITTTGNLVIGDCTLDLPPSGSVKIKLIVGFDFDSGVGKTSSSDTKIIYPFE